MNPIFAIRDVGTYIITVTWGDGTTTTSPLILDQPGLHRDIRLER